MKLSYSPFRLISNHPFGISRSTNDFFDVVFIYLKKDGIIGRGEAAPADRYNEFTADILKILDSGIDFPEILDDPIELFNIIAPQCQGVKSLEVAFSMAILDWWCQKQGVPLYEYLGADPNKAPKTSYTISIGDMDLIPEKVKEGAPYHILKVKLGMGIEKDKAIMNAIRQETDQLIRIDANEGWDLETGIEMSKWLADRNVEFVEQPFKSTNLKDTAELRQKSPLPLIADENSLYSGNIPEIEGIFDGINIKLMKCGSLLEGMKMVKMAREREMQIMLGCMIESSIAITAAAHLSPLVDYADLDGNLLINNDPYSGATIEDARLVLPQDNGLGISLNSDEPNLI